jgi:hypothetical protein
MSKKPSKRNTSGTAGGPLIHHLSIQDRERAAIALREIQRILHETKEVEREEAELLARFTEESQRIMGAALTASVRGQLAAQLDEILRVDSQGRVTGIIPSTERQRRAALNLRAAAEIGFVMAVCRYRSWLVGNREVEAILRHQDSIRDGVTKGHATQSRASEERAERIRATWASMEAAGAHPTNAKVAHACGCGVSTVIRAFKRKPAKRTKR